jgi:hypothetical protein
LNSQQEPGTSRLKRKKVEIKGKDEKAAEKKGKIKSMIRSKNST